MIPFLCRLLLFTSSSRVESEVLLRLSVCAFFALMFFLRIQMIFYAHINVCVCMCDYVCIYNKYIHFKTRCCWSNDYQHKTEVFAFGFSWLLLLFCAADIFFFCIVFVFFLFVIQCICVIFVCESKANKYTYICVSTK